jgi:hypothetical protein
VTYALLKHLEHRHGSRPKAAAALHVSRGILGHLAQLAGEYHPTVGRNEMAGHASPIQPGVAPLDPDCRSRWWCPTAAVLLEVSYRTPEDCTASQA